MNAVEYGHQRHALKEERAKEMAVIEVETAYLESKRADLASVFANIQQQLTCLQAAIRAKYLGRTRSYNKYLRRMQEFEAQFIASKHEVEP